MMPQKYIRLTDEDAAKLEALTRRSLNFRVRSRSQALLWSHQGKDRLTIAEMLGVHYKAFGKSNSEIIHKSETDHEGYSFTVSQSNSCTSKKIYWQV